MIKDFGYLGYAQHTCCRGVTVHRTVPALYLQVPPAAIQTCFTRYICIAYIDAQHVTFNVFMKLRGYRRPNNGGCWCHQRSHHNMELVCCVLACAAICKQVIAVLQGVCICCLARTRPDQDVSQLAPQEVSRTAAVTLECIKIRNAVPVVEFAHAAP
jgi:hypothetical protein